MQYGLIPEFIGRLPVSRAVHQLSPRGPDHDPHRAAQRDRQAVPALLRFDGIELVFSDDALKAVADRALERETGARGLRSIIEEILLEVQFELPSRRDVKKCVVTKETVERGIKPTLVTEAPDEGDRPKRVRLEAARPELHARLVADAGPGGLPPCRPAAAPEALSQRGIVTRGTTMDALAATAGAPGGVELRAPLRRWTPCACRTSAGMRPCGARASR